MHNIARKWIAIAKSCSNGLHQKYMVCILPIWLLYSSALISKLYYRRNRTKIDAHG